MKKHINIVFENTEALRKVGFSLKLVKGQFAEGERFMSFRGEHDDFSFKSKEAFAASLVRYLNNPKAKMLRAESRCTSSWSAIDLTTLLPIGSARISDVLSIL